MIPYAPGRDRQTAVFIARLNAGETIIPTSPAEITAMNAIKATYPTLVQSQTAIPNLPAGFVPYKLGAVSPQTPILSAAVCWFGHVTQAAGATPVLTETTATGLVLTKARTSAGLYPITGWPAGYTVHAGIEPVDPDHTVSADVAGGTVTLKSWNHATLADSLLVANPLMFVLMPT